MSFHTATRSGPLTPRRAPAVQHWVGSAGGDCAPPCAGAVPVDAGVGDGVLAAGAVTFEGAVTALKSVTANATANRPSTTRAGERGALTSRAG